MTIHIEDLQFKTIIGILDFERDTPQDVIVNLTIEYEYNDRFINYADVAHATKTFIIDEKFLLIEDALNNLAVKLKKDFLRINTLHIKITKPSILPNCRVSVSNLFNFIS